jgi:uncharacterized protein (DUF2461 family)
VGVYAPPPDVLLAVRRHLQEHHGELRTLLANRKTRRLLPDFDSNPLKRMPKGFAADHPAAEFLLGRQWFLSATLPREIAVTPALRKEIVDRFRVAAPLVSLLNAPLLRSTTPRKSLF